MPKARENVETKVALLPRTFSCNDTTQAIKNIVHYHSSATDVFLASVPLRLSCSTLASAERESSSKSVAGIRLRYCPVVAASTTIDTLALPFKDLRMVARRLQQSYKSGVGRISVFDAQVRFRIYSSNQRIAEGKGPLCQDPKKASISNKLLQLRQDNK
jgi:hypothetical protein